MAEGSEGRPQPGWYDDPGGEGQRYWDGTRWTTATRPPSGGPSSVATRAGSRGALLTVAFIAVLAVGIGGGFVVAGLSGDDPQTWQEDPATEDAPSADAGAVDPGDSGTTEQEDQSSADAADEGTADDAEPGDDEAADPADVAEPGDGSLEGASLTVGSKNFDEQLVLGEISVALLEDAGAEVNNQVNLGGTDATRAALESGEIDHYWEYTGTAWISFFGEIEPIQDRVEQYEAVRDREAAERGLFWLDPTAFNNTFGIALSREADAEVGGVDTTTEMGELLETDPDAVTLCVESEFNVRDDGLPGMEAHYGFEIPGGNVTVLDTGVIYGAVADRDPCNFGEVFTTDGRIAALDLKVLEDDRVFFPLYNAAPVFVEDAWTEYGQALEDLYAPVAAALDDPTMRVLNARVSAGGERPADVAADWLRASGFIR